MKECQNFLDKLYLPVPNKEQLIPQDDTYLSKPVIDLTTYKERPGSQSILLDYARSEVNELQVSKQADLVMLLYLLPEYFLNQSFLRICITMKTKRSTTHR